MSDPTPAPDGQTELPADDYGPDPELYIRMSEPYDAKQDADASLKRFMLGVKRLREECRIAEVVLLAANYVQADERGDNVTMRSLALGEPMFHAEMGAVAYQTYTLPVILRAADLAKIATTPEAVRGRLGEVPKR